MPKIVRKHQKIFGVNALSNQVAKFGSLAEGAPAFTKDPDVIQALTRFESGWFQGVLGNSNPTIEDMNALFYLYAYQLAYLMQTGVAEWNATTVYYAGSLVNDGVGNIYKSVQNDNTNHALSDPAWWASASGAGMITTNITGAGVLNQNNYYLANSTGGAFTRTLETGSTGARLVVVDAKGTSATNIITVMPATGQSINGQAINTAVYLDSNGMGYSFAWDGTTWIATKIGGAGGNGAGTLTPGLISTTGASANNTIEELDPTAGFIVRTLPAYTGAARSVRYVDRTGKCSATNYIRLTPNGTDKIFYKGVAGTDSLVLRRKHVVVEMNAAAGSDTWYATYQSVSTPTRASSANDGSVAPRKGQVDLSVTAATWTTTRAKGLYYQDQDGNHRFKFNIEGATTGTRATCSLTIAGVAFGPRYAAVSSYVEVSSVWTASSAYANFGGTNLLYVNHANLATTFYCISGDVELTSKPSWA